MANPTTTPMRESASRFISRMLRRSQSEHISIAPDGDEQPVSARNNLVDLRAERAERIGREWGFLSARHPDLTTPEKIRDALAAVRAEDDQWLQGVVRGEARMPPATAQDADREHDPALAEIRLQRTYGEIFEDVDTLRETPDDTLAQVRQRLRQAVDTPGATLPRGGVESGRAVLAEVEREVKLRAKARALIDQREYETRVGSDAELSSESRIELAGNARQTGERWLGADPDSQQALDFLSAADRQYARAVVEAKPAWLENTLGVDPLSLDESNSFLSAQRDTLAERIAHARFGRENLDDVAPRLDAVADMRLLKGIHEYQQAVGMIASPLGASHEHGIAM